MGPEIFITMVAQTEPYFLIMQIRRKLKYCTIHRLADDVETGAMRCNISKNHMILCRHVDHKCYYEAKTN